MNKAIYAMAVLCLLTPAAVLAQPAATAPATMGIYAPQPDQLWNRIHSLIFIRTASNGVEYGRDTADPLLWQESTYLLEPPVNGALLKALDELVATGGGELMNDPLKRAIFQHDLWTVFDWSIASERLAGMGRGQLRAGLAKAIKLLALTQVQIAALSDNYEAAITSRTFPTVYDRDRAEAIPFLPADLLRKDGSWTMLGTPNSLVARHHERDGLNAPRSLFTVFMRLPGGRAATAAYLNELNNFSAPLIATTVPAHAGSEPARARAPATRRVSVLDPQTPQFPSGTQMALVKRMLLIDADGRLSISPLIEQVQLRVYHTVASSTAQAITTDSEKKSLSGQSFFQFQLSREKLFQHESGGLRAIQPGEREFLTSQFPALTSDQITDETDPRREPSMTIALNNCITCHAAPNAESFLTYRDFSQSIGPRRKLIDITNSPESDQSITLNYKIAQDEWAALGELWQGGNRR